MVASVWVFLHRLPHHEYAAVHKDKGRPKVEQVVGYYGSPSAPSAASASSSTLPQLGSTFTVDARRARREAAAEPVAVLPPMPAFPILTSAGMRTLHLAPEPLPTLPEAAVASEPLDLETACEAEYSLLCHSVSMERLPMCLAPYEKALTNSCHQALKAKGESLPPPPAGLESQCLPEARLLCNRVPVERLPTCLAPYNEALRSTCRVALREKGVRFETDN